MKEELLKIINEFTDELHKHNMSKSHFEDDELPTFENFIKWLKWDSLV